jgi:sporulation protein YlmC with PRC-barrel domain
MPGCARQSLNRRSDPMIRSITLLASVALLALSLGGAAFSQGAPQTVTLMKVDPASLASGYRASKVVGSTVVNDRNETVGTIDDLIITSTDKVPFAVLSVGGFLGMGSKYVVVPFNSIQVQDKKMVLAGATKDSLKALPAFTYNTAN